MNTERNKHVLILFIVVDTISAFLVYSIGWVDEKAVLLMFSMWAINVVGFMVMVTKIGMDRANSLEKEKHARNDDLLSRNGIELSLVGVRMKSNKKGEFVQYKILVELGPDYDFASWCVWRRYREFENMSKFSHTAAEFPRKSTLSEYLSSKDMKLSFLEKRRLNLQQYLRRIVPDMKSFQLLISQGPEVRKFFGIPKHVNLEPIDLGPSKEEVIERARFALKTVLKSERIAQNGGNEEWKLYKKNSEGISCYLKTEGDFTFAMGDGPVDATPVQMLKLLQNSAGRKDWDPLFDSEEDLDTIMPLESLEIEETQNRPDAIDVGIDDIVLLSCLIKYTRFNSPAKMVVAVRDSVSVAVCARRKSDGAFIVALTAIDDPRAPREGKDGYVRSKVICAGFTFKERPQGGSEVFSVGMVDPNGNIPSFVVNTVAPQRIFALTEMAKFAKKLSQ